MTCGRNALTSRTPDPGMHTVRLIVLGAPAVGKTSLIEVLVSHSVQPLRPLAESAAYNVTALSDGLILCVTLVEVEPGSDLTSTTRLMTADAYVLLFDLTSPGTYLSVPTPDSPPSTASFQFVRLLRDQLFEGRSGRTPVFVVGNKADLVPVRRTTTHADHNSQHWEPAVGFRDLSALIRKQWKWSYWEVSALHDWHVQSMFQRLLHSVSHSRIATDGSDLPTARLPVAQPAPTAPQHSPHCLIL